MRRAAVVASLILASTAAWAQRTPYYTENFPGSNRANWHPQNGTLTEDATSGLSSPTSGSLITNRVAPGSAADYEMRVTYKLAASGGSYVTYMRATPNAQLTTVYGVATPGNFYAFELNNPQFSGGNCSVLLAVWKNQYPSLPPALHSMMIGCANEFSLRFVVRGGTIFVLREGAQNALLWLQDGSISNRPRPQSFGDSRPGV
jgi:hypothetical protein